MRTRGLLAIVGLICFIVLTGLASPQADSTPDLNSLSDSDLKTVTIRLERTTCFGSCEAYILTIHGDGNIEYVGKQNVKEKRTINERFEASSIKSLIAEFAEAKFLSVPENYSEQKCACRYCTDMPTTITELVVKGVTHTVTHYYGCACAPKALFELETAIDKFANSEQWTGDVSKQGPFGTTCFDKRPAK